jgi:hypothetical protein
MSAFQVQRKRCDGHFCTNGCKNKNGPAAANDRITLLGYPLGWFCPSCVRDLKRAWAAAQVNWETEQPDAPVRRVLASQGA